MPSKEQIEEWVDKRMKQKGYSSWSSTEASYGARRALIDLVEEGKIKT